MDLRYLYVGSSDTGRDVASWLAVPGARVRWRFQHFGADVAAIEVGSAPTVLLADHRPAGSVLPIYAVIDIDTVVEALAAHGWTIEARAIGTPEGPAAVVRDLSGTEVAFLRVDRPSAMETAFGARDNTHAVRPVADGVLITGVYGAGKSAVTAEIADMLERQGSSYAALDLDWLTWFDIADDADADAQRVFLKNLSGVVHNYLAAGVQRFVMAYAVRDRSALDDLRAAVPITLRVVRLDLALEEIERRLRPEPTTGRRDDLRVAALWLADSTGVGLEDLTIDNAGQIQEVAAAIVEWLGWTARA